MEMLNSARVDEAIDRADAALDRGDFDRAIAECNAAIILAPESAEAHGLRGQAYLGKRDHERAIADCAEALRLNPGLAWVYPSRGRAHRETGEYAKARADFTNGVCQDPTQAEGHQGLAWLLATCPDPAFRDGATALRHAKAACAFTDWNEPQALSAFAAVHAELGNFEDAVLWQTKALELAQEHDDAAMRSFAETARQHLKLFEDGHPCIVQPASSAAAAAGDDALDVSFDDAASCTARGDKLLSTGAYAEAIAAFTEAIDLDDQFTPARLQRGNAYLACGRYGDAVADLLAAMTLAPTDAEIRRALAWTLATCPDERARLGSKAVELATQACELLEWKDAAGLDVLAAAYAEVGEFATAIQWQKKAMACARPTDAFDLAAAGQRMKMYQAGRPFREGVPSTHEFVCQNARCQKLLRPKPEMAGKRIKCPGCGTVQEAPTPLSSSEVFARFDNQQRDVDPFGTSGAD